jgi:iron only hydrogenase large subunit-like protein
MPCFDKKAYKSCEHRTADCRLTCEAWKKYKEEKELEYEERHKKVMNQYLLKSYFKEIIQKKKAVYEKNFRKNRYAR